MVIFSGSPDAPEAFIRIREVKDYPNRYVPLEEFSAIRPPNLQKNLRAISKGVEDGMAAITNGAAVAAPLDGLSLPQLGAIRRAVDRNQVRIEVVVGPTTKVGAESGRGASVMSVLRQEIRAASGDVDVLAPELDRVETPFADAAAAASERQGR